MPSSVPLAKPKALETTLSLCRHLLEEINTPRALSILILMNHGEWDTIAVGLPLEASWYTCEKRFFLDYQATKLLQKADFLPTSFDVSKTALVRFESAEELCRETNKRWRSAYLEGRALPDHDVDCIISDATRLIHDLLGRFPHDRLVDSCRWGPGATTSIRNPGTSVYRKYLEPLTGSGPCLTLFAQLLEQIPLWRTFQKGVYCVSDGNKVVFVPKDAKTKRSIAAEPSFDSFIQLGIGRLMRERLPRWGIDLSNQELNRDLACYGSLTGKVATVDLSMASDTAAKAVIDGMFPTSWLVAMKACRSTHWRMGSRSGAYHKFSSMGNGYTFEMETILFAAIAKAVAVRLGLPPWEVTAYGDDITIGVEGVPLLTRALTFLGFSVNASKSFDSGVFRESCGKDFFLGSNVRPYFIRSLLRDERDLMKFHNGILKGLIPFHMTASKSLRLCDPRRRLFGPASLGDTVFWSKLPRGWFTPASKKFPMFEGFIIRHWVFKPRKLPVHFYEPAILASLHSNAESPSLGFHTLRQRGTWVTRTVIIPGWDD